MIELTPEEDAELATVAAAAAQASHYASPETRRAIASRTMELIAARGVRGRGSWSEDLALVVDGVTRELRRAAAQRLSHDLVTQGATVVTLQAKVAELERLCATGSDDMVRLSGVILDRTVERDAARTEVDRLKAQLTTAQHEVATNAAWRKMAAELHMAAPAARFDDDAATIAQWDEAKAAYYRLRAQPNPGAELLQQHHKEVELLTDLLVGYRKAGRLEHERANRAEAEAERLWCESWGAAAVISLLLEEGVENFRAAQAGAMAVLENPRLTAENERLSHRLMMMTDLRDSYRKGGTMEHVRANLLESEKDGWRMLALRLLVLGVMVRAQWERYVLAAGQSVDGCPGPGKCHGPLSWCARCGEVGLLCDMNGRCHLHRERWQEYVLEHAPVAKLARDEGHEAGRLEASMEARKEVESIQNKLRRARTDAWAEAVDVINGEPLTSQEAREAMAPILVQWVERELAVRPFLALARDRLASRSYEPIPAAACARLLKAFNAVSGEEKHDD